MTYPVVEFTSAVELIKEFGLDGDSIAAKVKEFVK